MSDPSKIVNDSSIDCQADPASIDIACNHGCNRMRLDRQQALDRAISKANVSELRDALREALGIREHELVNRSASRMSAAPR